MEQLFEDIDGQKQKVVGYPHLRDDRYFNLNEERCRLPGFISSRKRFRFMEVALAFAISDEFSIKRTTCNQTIDYP